MYILRHFKLKWPVVYAEVAGEKLPVVTFYRKLCESEELMAYIPTHEVILYAKN